MPLLDWLLGRPYWEYSATVALVALAVFLVERRKDGARHARIAAFGRDLALVAGVFAVYQHTVHYARLNVAGAFDHARTVVDIEEFLHIRNEVGLQQLVLPHPELVKFLNGYYAGVHITSMILFMLWVMWFHRAAYPAARNVVFMSTLTCVLIQIYPVAPPRLLTDLGFVDTAVLYGQSVYGIGGGEVAGQLAAMPSIHVAWAAIIAWYAVRLSRSAWRWLFPAHFVLTLVVVAATANHWWLDGIVSVGIVALALVVQQQLERVTGGRAKGAHEVLPVPAQVA